MSDDDPINRREFEAFGKLMDERKESLHEALGKAEATVAARFESVNNLREQINMERGRYLTVEKFEGVEQRFNGAIGELQSWRANMTGRMWAVNIVLVLLTLGINFASYLVGHR